MSKISKVKKLFDRRKVRNRYKIAKFNKSNRIRLTVFRSGCHIYGQFIDDIRGVTLASASSLGKNFKAQHSKGSNIVAAKAVGSMLAKHAVENNITLNQIVFDRGGYLFHGRVKALIDAVVERLS